MNSSNDNIVWLTISELCILLLFIMLAAFSYYSFQNESYADIESANCGLVEDCKAELQNIKTEVAIDAERQENLIDQLKRELQDAVAEAETDSQRQRDQIKIIELKLQEAVESAEVLAKKLHDQDRLRSTMKPSCIEIGLVEGFLCTIEILSGDSYRIDYETYTYTELLRHFQRNLKSAQENECVLSVRVKSSKDISASEYDVGLRKIERKFYVKRVQIR